MSEKTNPNGYMVHGVFTSNSSNDNTVPVESRPEAAVCGRGWDAQDGRKDPIQAFSKHEPTRNSKRVSVKDAPKWLLKHSF